MQENASKDFNFKDYNFLFLWFDVSDTKTIGYIKSPVNYNSQNIKPNILEFDWVQFLEDKEKDFMKNFFLTRYNKKYETLFKILMARHFYEHINNNVSLNRYETLFSDEKIQSFGIEVNYQKRENHNTCLDLLKKGGFHANRQVDFCVKTVNNKCYFIEVKQSNSLNQKEIDQQKNYIDYIQLFKDQKINIECVHDEENEKLITYLNPSNKERCKCEAEVNEKNCINEVQMIYIFNFKKALERLKINRVNRIKEMAEELSKINNLDKKSKSNYTSYTY